jgi:hypothetical protein
MSNWYAYKVLADTYHADRHAEAARHRQVREARRAAANRGPANNPRRARHALAASRPAPGPVTVGAVARTGPWSAIAARLRLRRRPAAVAGPARPNVELHPSMPC